MQLKNLRIRTKTNRRGITHTYYFYEHARDENGKRRLEPLGSDLVKAQIEWAKRENATMQQAKLRPDDFSVAAIYARYMAWAEVPANSGLAPRTISDRKKYWRSGSDSEPAGLGPVFGRTPIDALLPEHIVRYFDARSSKSTAKKELKFLSVLCSWAKARGWMRAANPCTGGTIKQLKVQEGRDVYVSDALYWFVHEFCDQLVRDCLDLAYYCGTRPTEALTLKWSDAAHKTNGVEEIWIKLPKTTKSGVKIRRVRVAGDLKALLERIRARPIVGRTILCDEDGQALALQGKFRYRFDQARDQAEARIRELEAELGADRVQELGLGWIRFQFRDLRPKAATDNERVHGMGSTRKLLGHTTENQTASYVRNLTGELVDPVAGARPAGIQELVLGQPTVEHIPARRA